VVDAFDTDLLGPDAFANGVSLCL